MEKHRTELYEDEALISSRALREKIESEMGQRDPFVLSDRANLQDSRSSASSGRSAHGREQGPRQPNRETQRKSWAAGMTAAASRMANSKSKTTIDDVMDDLRSGKDRRKRSAIEKPADGPAPTRGLSVEGEAPQIDLVQDSFAPLGRQVDPHGSAVWDISTARTTLPADRKAAAVARIHQRKAERARNERNKENVAFV